MDKLTVKYNVFGNQYIGFPDDVKEEIDNLEELGIDKMILWDINKPVRAELIKDPLETFANKIMK